MSLRFYTHPKKKPVRLEDLIHVAIADLMRFKGHPRLLWFHPPNEGERTGREGERLKRMGMLPGVADFALTLPDGRSAFIEVKAPNGKQSPEQIAFVQCCFERGIPYALVRSSLEAERVLQAWGALSMRERRRAA